AGDQRASGEVAQGAARSGIRGLRRPTGSLATPEVTDLEKILRHIQSELEGRGKQWSLVGGLAVVVRGEPRFTRDADLAVAVGNDAEAESLVRGLQERGGRKVPFPDHPKGL